MSLRPLQDAAAQAHPNLVEIRSLTPEEREEYRRREQEFIVESNRKSNELAQKNYVESLRKNSGLGARFSSRTFASWRRTMATEAAYNAAVAATSKPALWLYGPPRMGKTHLIAAVVNAMHDDGVPAIFCSGVELLDRLRDAIDKPHLQRGVDRLVADLATVNVAALDDLGTERFTPYAADRLYAIIDARYKGADTSKPAPSLMVTSNVHPSELADLWSHRDLDRSMGEKLVGRLLEMAGGNVVPICA